MFGFFNNYIEKFNPGSFPIAARPAMGKTTVARHIITDMTRKICGTLWKTSDVIIFLWRDAYYVTNQETDIMNIIVAKNIPYGETEIYKEDFLKMVTCLETDYER